MYIYSVSYVQCVRACIARCTSSICMFNWHMRAAAAVGRLQPRLRYDCVNMHALHACSRYDDCRRTPEHTQKHTQFVRNRVLTPCRLPSPSSRRRSSVFNVCALACGTTHSQAHMSYFQPTATSTMRRHRLERIIHCKIRTSHAGLLQCFRCVRGVSSLASYLWRGIETYANYTTYIYYRLSVANATVVVVVVVM